ncbi:MAG: transglutaminase-like domain-containing protein [Rhodobacterales bacterium]
MRIEIAVDMQYSLGGDPMVLLNIEAAQVPGQTIVQHHLGIDFATIARVAGEGGVGQRVWACVASDQMWLGYRATVEVDRPTVALESLSAAAPHDLPGEVFTYLRPSRFCQSDLFQNFAAQRFGGLQGGQKVAAIRDWVARELRYVPASSHAETTVLETFTSREGVCRDYAHMVCALARAAQIPARYASVYGPDVTPQDFHAVAEVWLDGAWHMVDATGMGHPGEMVLIAVGRDAHDIAFMETQTPAYLLNQQVRVSRQ